MEAQMLNAVYLKMLPKFDPETIKVGDFVIIKVNTGKVEVSASLPQGVEPPTIYSSAAVQVTAVREDELMVRVVEVLGGRYATNGYFNRYLEIHQCAYEAGDPVILRPKDVHDGTVEIWPAKAVIPGM